MRLFLLAVLVGVPVACASQVTKASRDAPQTSAAGESAPIDGGLNIQGEFTFSQSGQEEVCPDGGEYLHGCDSSAEGKYDIGGCHLVCARGAMCLLNPKDCRASPMKISPGFELEE